MLLYIIRHGEPNYDLDILTERGRLQAESVGIRLKEAGITRVFSSPMGRARETAEPTCRLLGLDCGIEEWAHEVEGERLTSYPYNDNRSISYVPSYIFREGGDIDLPYSSQFDSKVISASGMKSALERIERGGEEFLTRLGYKNEGGIYKILEPNDERVALFCHSVMSRAWLSSLLHIPIHMMWSDFVYTFTGVTVLKFENYESGFTSPRVMCYSDISHLYAHGPDTVYDGGIKI